jgi:hypothetical protein
MAAAAVRRATAGVVRSVEPPLREDAAVASAADRGRKRKRKGAPPCFARSRS